MSVIKLAAFTGESPRITPRLLPDTGAQIAQSVRLEDGELAPYRKPYPIYALPGAQGATVKTIYRHLGDWLWWSSVVHAVPGPVAQDRLYYTGDGKPKMRVGSTVYDLALTAPTAALTGTVTGTVNPATSATRLYVYTRVTQYGEESTPSPISTGIVVSPGNTVTLSGFTAAPTGRSFTKQRIYRSQTGTSGGANLYFIGERDDSTANFTDNIAVDAFNEALPSLDWNPPPDGLTGLVALPNGGMAGYVGKDLYFCEPYRPHAWPVKYSLSANYDITGLAVSGTTIIVGTKGTPVLVGGVSPDTMTMEHLEFNMPCLNAQGMVDMGYAALYPSNDGLVMVQGGVPNLVSENLLTRDQWQKLNPASLVCGQFYGRFYASYQYVDVNQVQQNGTLIFDITGSQPYLIRSQHRADAMFYDIRDNQLYMAIGGTVYEWDALAADNDIMTYRSKAFVTPQPTSFGVILAEASTGVSPDALQAAQAARVAIAAQNDLTLATKQMRGAIGDMSLNSLSVNGDSLKALPGGPQISINVYADGEFLTTINTIGDSERLPAVLARQWEIEVTGNIVVQEITMAGTGQELRSV